MKTISKKTLRKKSHRKKTQKNQKFYNMKGCSKKGCSHLGQCSCCKKIHCMNKLCKCNKSHNLKGGCNCKLMGGSNIRPLNPEEYINTGVLGGSSSNGFLAYTGKEQMGGCNCGLVGGGNSLNIPLAYTGKSHTYLQNPNLAYTGKSGGIFNSQKGGYNYNSGDTIKYPDGLVGKPWTPEISSWPGVNGVGGDSNFLSFNKYLNDPQTQHVIQERTTPIMKGGKTKKKRGGNYTFFPQDLVNLGREFSYNLGSTYNALNGSSQLVNPLPFKDQFVK